MSRSAKLTSDLNQKLKDEQSLNLDFSSKLKDSQVTNFDLKSDNTRLNDMIETLTKRQKEEKLVMDAKVANLEFEISDLKSRLSLATSQRDHLEELLGSKQQDYVQELAEKEKRVCEVRNRIIKVKCFFPIFIKFI